MKISDDGILFICVTVLFIFFYGCPDLHDKLVGADPVCEKEDK